MAQTCPPKRGKSNSNIVYERQDARQVEKVVTKHALGSVESEREAFVAP